MNLIIRPLNVVQTSANPAARPRAYFSEKDAFSSRSSVIPLDVRTIGSPTTDLAIVKLLFYTVFDWLAFRFLMELGDAQVESRILHRKPVYAHVWTVQPLRSRKFVPT
jgi:hypothetical protein